MERSERPEQGQSVLRRKLARKRGKAAQAGEGEDKAAPAPRAHPFERALARAGAAIGGGLHTTARLTAAREIGQAELMELVEPDGFLTLLNAGETGADAAGSGMAEAGLFALDGGAFMALVEILTTGRLSATARTPRRATATDAALLCDFIDNLLRLRRQELEKQGADAPEAEPAAEIWQRGRFVNDARLLSVLLEEGGFRLEQLEITLTLGDEQRSGRVLLGLPLPAAAPATAGDDGAEGGADAVPGRPEAWQRRVESMVMAVPAELHAVLGRVSLPLDEVLQLGPDSRLTLPVSQLEEVRLEAGDRRLLALGRLGQYRGMRALRLTGVQEGAQQAGSMLAGPAAAPPQAMPAPSMMPPGDMPPETAEAG